MIRSSNFHVLAIFVILQLLMLGCINKTVQRVNNELFIEVYDKELAQYIDTTHLIESLANGFVWSEGPVWVETENKLLFTDVPQNIMHEWSDKDGLKKWLEPSGYTAIYKDGGTQGANGLALNTDNKLIICQHGDRRIVKYLGNWQNPTTEFEVLVDVHNGKRLNSPNDLHVDGKGNIFFTDPPYGLPQQDEDIAKDLSFNGVFVLKSNGALHVIDTTLSRPNGIALAADTKTLYVANSDKSLAIWMKYILDEDFNVVSKEVFADKTYLLESSNGLPDGLKIHDTGLIFATGPGGVLIFHPDGRHLGTIKTGKATANCTFDKDYQHLYMTAHDVLMRVKLK